MYQLRRKNTRSQDIVALLIVSTMAICLVIFTVLNNIIVHIFSPGNHISLPPFPTHFGLCIYQGGFGSGLINAQAKTFCIVHCC